MQSVTLSGDVQQKDQYGVWRTVLTASGFTLRDYRRHPVDAIDEMMFGYVRAPYVPGKVGAFMPTYNMEC